MRTPPVSKEVEPTSSRPACDAQMASLPDAHLNCLDGAARICGADLWSATGDAFDDTPTSSSICPLPRFRNGIRIRCCRAPP